MSPAFRINGTNSSHVGIFIYEIIPQTNLSVFGTFIGFMQRLKQSIHSLLRTSEKYTKTDMLYLAQGRFLIGSHLVSLIGSFAIAITFAHFLPKDIFGSYKYILSITEVLAALTLTGLSASLTRAVAKKYDGSFVAAFKARLTYSWLFVFLACSGSLYYFLQGNATFGISLLIIAILDPLIRASSLYAAFLNGKKEFACVSKYNIVRTVITTIAIIIAAYTTQSVIGIIATYCVAHTLTTYVLYKKSHQKIENDEQDPELVRYGTHLSLAEILAKVSTHLDSILVFQFLGSTQLAIYAFATLVPNHIRGFSKKVGTLAMSKFSEQSIDYIRSGIFKKTGMFMLGLTGVTVLYIIIAPFIFTYIFPQYTEAILISQIFSLSLIFPAIIPRTVLLSQKAIKENYFLTIFTSIFSIIIITSSLYFYGLIGLAIGRVINHIVLFTVSTILVKNLSESS